MKQHKKILSILLALGMMVAMIPTSTIASTTYGDAEQRVIIVYKNKADAEAVRKANGRVSHEYRNIPAVAATMNGRGIAEMKRNPNVALVEPDAKVEISAQTEDWGLDAIQVTTSWAIGYTGKGVKVAILDTGISLAHPDLVVSGGHSAVDYTTSYNDDHGHGTHVAGIVGAKNNDIGVVGAAPDASLYAVKVMNQSGGGYVSDMIEGIDWSISNKMHIINMSIGTPSYSSAMDTVVNKAYRAGILIVAAAGNNGTADGSADTVEYPARLKNAIAVGAVDASNIRPYFSATGETVEVAAPGVSIMSTYLNGGYAYMSGTSMATPYAAGTLALIKQANPTASAGTLRLKLQTSAIDLGVTGKDSFYGYGLIQGPKAAAVTVTEPTPRPSKRK